MDKIIWQYWEGPRPSFIDLCLETVSKNNEDFDLRVLDDKSVFDYLPNLRKDLDSLPRIANKVDYVRFKLLHEYGGIWLDADVVLLQDLSKPWQTMINSNQSFAATSHFGPGKPSIWLLMSERNSKITKDYLKAADVLLDNFDKSKIAWSQLGAHLLWNFTNDKNYCHFAVEDFCPVPYTKYLHYFENIDVDKFISDDSYTFVFFNEMLNRHQRDFLAKDRNEILSQDYLISKIIRKAIYQKRSGQ